MITTRFGWKPDEPSAVIQFRKVRSSRRNSPFSVSGSKGRSRTTPSTRSFMTVPDDDERTRRHSMPGFVSLELRDAVDGRPLMLADHSARMGMGC